MTINKDIIVPRDATDEQLGEALCPLWEATEEAGARLMISGYGADPRELWEVPEAVALCRRMVRLGYLSFLELIPEGYGDDDRHLGPMAEPGRGMTGIGLWAIARKIPVRGHRMEFSDQDLKAFLAEVDASNARVRSRIERRVILPDGQHRVRPEAN